jgi:hypothetical protein
LLESLTLSLPLQRELVDILANYDPEPKDVDTRTNCEFEPRNAIVFMNSSKEAIEYTEICFKCLQFRSSVAKEVRGLCSEKSQKLMAFFKKAGIIRGIY